MREIYGECAQCWALHIVPNARPTFVFKKRGTAFTIFTSNIIVLFSYDICTLDRFLIRRSFVYNSGINDKNYTEIIYQCSISYLGQKGLNEKYQFSSTTNKKVYSFLVSNERNSIEII